MFYLAARIPGAQGVAQRAQTRSKCGSSEKGFTMKQYSKRDELALQIINLAKAEILLENPFLAEVLGRLTNEPTSLDGASAQSKELHQFSVNGETLGFDSGAVIAHFRMSGGKSPKHDLLHSALHCVFLHPFVGKSIDVDAWNLAADIAAERVAAEVLGPREEPRGASIERALSWIEDQLGGRATAEKVYRRLARGQWQNMVSAWELLFTSDEHRCWYAPPLDDQGLSSGEAQVDRTDDATCGKENNGEEPQAGQGDKRHSDTPPERDEQEEWADEPGENEAPDSSADSSVREEQQPRDYPGDDASSFASESENDAAPVPSADDNNPAPCETQANNASEQGISGDNASPENVSPTPDKALPGLNAPNDQADKPGASSSEGRISARAQGEGAGAGKEIYVSQRAGARLRDAATRGDFMQKGRAAAARRSNELRDEWAHVATNLSVNLQTYARDKASAFADLAADLDQVTARPVDYRVFLRRFAALGEVMRASDDEFDYVFYTYGLRLYENLPLVEPLEYREEARIRQFVIVIDTSGSVQGDIVRRFVDTTFDILSSTESFHREVQVRIIQCDATVQSDDKITNVADMKKWRRAFRLRGGGGTDFRPAFDYVDSLIDQGELDDLGGLLYFTDGWGTYPERMPAYRCAFVFYDENYRAENVPPWAMQVVMDQAALDRATRG